jgi:hypothetical protein
LIHSGSTCIPAFLGEVYPFKRVSLDFVQTAFNKESEEYGVLLFTFLPSFLAIAFATENTRTSILNQ